MRALPVAALSALLLTACTEQPSVEFWPPKVGRTFPAMKVLDHRGELVDLNSYAGKVLLIEPIGMPCQGCIAFCGGEEHGAFEGIAPQADMPSFDDLYERFTGGLDLDDPEVVVVQMIFFALDMGTPTVADAKKWHDHFKVGQRRNHVVLIGPESIRDRTMPNIPGYWLVDRDFVVRKDATGHNPQDNLFTSLLPAVPDLLERSAASPR